MKLEFNMADITRDDLIAAIKDRMVTVTLSAADAIAVGATLRMLARTSPCGDALERVGAELVKAAAPREPRVRGVKGNI